MRSSNACRAIPPDKALVVAQKVAQRRMLREALQDLTLEAIAEAAETTKQVVSRIEQGHTYPDLQIQPTHCACCGQRLED